jgi:hypothetical protein
MSRDAPRKRRPLLELLATRVLATAAGKRPRWPTSDDHVFRTPASKPPTFQPCAGTAAARRLPATQCEWPDVRWLCDTLNRGGIQVSTKAMLGRWARFRRTRFKPNEFKSVHGSRPSLISLTPNNPVKLFAPRSRKSASPLSACQSKTGSTRTGLGERILTPQQPDKAAIPKPYRV